MDDYRHLPSWMVDRWVLDAGRVVGPGARASVAWTPHTLTICSAQGEQWTWAAPLGARQGCAGDRSGDGETLWVVVAWSSDLDEGGRTAYWLNLILRRGEEVIYHARGKVAKPYRLRGLPQTYDESAVSKVELYNVQRLLGVLARARASLAPWEPDTPWALRRGWWALGRWWRGG
jgi:hypothetical protein